MGRSEVVTLAVEETEIDGLGQLIVDVAKTPALLQVTLALTEFMCRTIFCKSLVHSLITG